MEFISFRSENMLALSNHFLPGLDFFITVDTILIRLNFDPTNGPMRSLPEPNFAGKRSLFPVFMKADVGNNFLIILVCPRRSQLEEWLSKVRLRTFGMTRNYNRVRSELCVLCYCTGCNTQWKLLSPQLLGVRVENIRLNSCPVLTSDGLGAFNL